MDTIGKYAPEHRFPTLAVASALAAMTFMILARRAANRARWHAKNAQEDAQRAIAAESRMKTTIAAQRRPDQE